MKKFLDPDAKEGMKIMMINMSDDPNPIAPGTMGTIRLIDDMGTIHVKWDDGRMLGVIPGVDMYKLMTESSGLPNMPELKNTKTNQEFKKIKGIKAESNEIKGGKSDKMSVEDIAKKHKLSVKKINKELEVGIKVEKEHVGNDESKAKEIAMDHISEFPDYYSNKKYGVLASEKGLKKSNKKVKTETTGAASAGAYVGPAFASPGPLTTGKGVTKPGPLKKENYIIKKSDLIREVMTKDVGSYDDSNNEPWADKNKDGWKWNDKSVFEGGEIVDPVAKINATWDDSNLDISKEWDKYQSKLTKENVISEVKSRLNESKKKKQSDEEEIDETTTFGSALGSGSPVTPIFAAKQGQWRTGKNPIYKGGKIVQKIKSDGVLNEANPVKYNKGGSFVKIKKKCTKFPYCSQGAIDNPLDVSKSIKGNASYVEEELMKKVHEVAKETGKTFHEVYQIVKKSLNN